MSKRILVIISLLGVALGAAAQEAPVVRVSTQGPQTAINKPGAPTHTVGLERYEQTYMLDTGKREYGLRYVVSRDPNKPEVAVIGEGYIGMPFPANQNWYASGFFELFLNGQTIGTVPIYLMAGRTNGSRGYVDFVWDLPQAVVRVRFMGLAGDDALYCQLLLEPKIELKSVRVGLRCYPSAFVTDGDRHVLTPVRDLSQGQRVDLDPATEWWALYFDKIFDEGYISAGRTGVGGCSALWPGSQIEKATVNVGSYSVDTSLLLKPVLHDFRFVFFDYKGMKNEAAKADLQSRAATLLQTVATLRFTDEALAQWDLAKQQEEVKRALALVPEEKTAAANYERWAKELAEQLPAIRAGSAGAIMSEARAIKTIGDWERGLPDLRLKALLKEI